MILPLINLTNSLGKLFLIYNVHGEEKFLERKEIYDMLWITGYDRIGIYQNEEKNWNLIMARKGISFFYQKINV